MRKNSSYTKFDWLDIFTEPIKFPVISRIRIWRYYEKGFRSINKKQRNQWKRFNLDVLLCQYACCKVDNEKCGIMLWRFYTLQLSLQLVIHSDLGWRCLNCNAKKFYTCLPQKNFLGTQLQEKCYKELISARTILVYTSILITVYITLALVNILKYFSWVF